MDLHTFITTLRDHIAQTPPPEDTESILELLFNAYTEVTGLDNETIREDFNTLYAAMNGKSIREMDEILYPVCTLCRDHEKPASRKASKLASAWPRSCPPKS